MVAVAATSLLTQWRGRSGRRGREAGASMAVVRRRSVYLVKNRRFPLFCFAIYPSGGENEFLI